MSGFRSMTRRALFAVLGAAGLLGLTQPQARAQSGDFVIAGNGDPYVTMWNKALVEPFTKQTGFPVTWSVGMSAQHLAKINAQKGNPQIDVAFLDEVQYLQGKDLDLWEPIGKADLGDISNVVPQAVAFNSGIAYGVSSIGIYYDPEVFAANKWAPPDSWFDLLRPELSKKITTLSLGNTSGINILIALNNAAGGKTPENMDPGFGLAKKIAENCLTIDTFGDTAQLIQQKAVVAGAWLHQRVVDMASKGVPLKFVQPKEGSWGHLSMAMIVKGRPAANTAAAKKLLALLLTREVQSAATLVTLPTNKLAASPEAAGILAKVNFSEQRAVMTNRAAWVERWGKEIERR